MKIENIQKSSCEIVEFYNEDHIYERYSKGNWGIRIGESVESVLIPNEVRELDDSYEEYMNQDVADDYSGERKRLTLEDVVSYQKRLEFFDKKEDLAEELIKIMQYLNDQCNPKELGPTVLGKVSAYIEVHGILGKLLQKL